MKKHLLYIAMTVCTLILATLGPMSRVAAQYLYELPPAFKTNSVDMADALALNNEDALWSKLAAATKLELNGAFLLEAGMKRRYRLGYASDGVIMMEEELIVPLNPNYSPAPVDEIAYTFAGCKLYIACGHAGVKDWDPLIVTCCMVLDGEVTELARHECGANYAVEIYALDVTHDGIIELVIPWMTGVGGGGGIDVFSVLMTGGFSGYGPELKPMTLYSYIGSMQLVDVNGDSSWELQTWYPILPSVMGYMFSELYTYDPSALKWVDGSHLKPGFFSDQLDFYRELNSHVERLALEPGEYHQNAEWIKYGCFIDGGLYSLDGFLTGEDNTVDEYMAKELREFIGRMGS